MAAERPKQEPGALKRAFTPEPIPEDELEEPGLRTIWKILRNAVSRVFKDDVGKLLGSAFVVLMLWGYHGEVELLGQVWSGWTGPGSHGHPDRADVIPGIPWDQEWIAFAIGLVLLVGIPCLLIKRVFKRNLSDYGLGPPPDGRWKLTLLSGVVLFVVCAPAFYLGTTDEAMRATYPLFKGLESTSDFVVYELGYLAFFIAIEFIFRGYLLFGLFGFRQDAAPAGVRATRDTLVFGYYAILVSMLSYTAWHLGKPVPELWGTLVWGIAAGAIALATRTIWHIIVVHWLLNVFMDYVIWQGG